MCAGLSKLLAVIHCFPGTFCPSFEIDGDLKVF